MSAFALRRIAWILLLPCLVAIMIFIIYPTILLGWLSFHEKHSYLETQKYVGLSNFQHLIDDPGFWRAVSFTLLYTTSTVAIQLVLGLGAALALVRLKRGVAFVLALSLLPYVLPTVLVSLIWRWILHDSLGFMNMWLASTGLLAPDFAWFDKGHIIMTLIMISVWQFFPFVFLISYAKLSTIPNIRYEAASVDGLSPWKQFWSVTLPEMKPVILTVLILRGLWMFTKFDTVWLVSGKEAIGEYTVTLPVLAYRTTFQSSQAGLGAAISIALVVIIMLLGIVYWRLTSGGMETT